MTIFETAIGAALGIIISAIVIGYWNRFCKWRQGRCLPTEEGELCPHTYKKEVLRASWLKRHGLWGVRNWLTRFFKK